MRARMWPAWYDLKGLRHSADPQKREEVRGEAFWGLLGTVWGPLLGLLGACWGLLGPWGVLSFFMILYMRLESPQAHALQNIRVAKRSLVARPAFCNRAIVAETPRVGTPQAKHRRSTPQLIGLTHTQIFTDTHDPMITAKFPFAALDTSPLRAP